MSYYFLFKFLCILEETKNNPLGIVDFFKSNARKIYTFQVDKPKHKVKKDYEDPKTLTCNKLSLTAIIDENKQKKAPADEGTSASANEQPFN